MVKFTSDPDFYPYQAILRQKIFEGENFILAEPYPWVPEMGWGSTKVVKFTSDLDFYEYQAILRQKVFEGEKFFSWPLPVSTQDGVGIN